MLRGSFKNYNYQQKLLGYNDSKKYCSNHKYMGGSQNKYKNNEI